jgi:flagellar hook-basal body complex protein FliE
MIPITPVGLGLNPIQPPTMTAVPAVQVPEGTPNAVFQDFGSLLNQAIGAITDTQATADSAATALITGQSTDIHTAMIAMEKAKVTFDLAVQVRNKTLDAYNELIRTQV